MNKFDEQMKRWKAILGDSAEGTQEEALDVFFGHLKANLQLPSEVTGTEDFRWEEPYVLGGVEPAGIRETEGDPAFVH